MKKYIYGAALIAVVAACGIFFFRPPEVTDRTGSMTIAVAFSFPEGYEFTQEAPFMLTWQTESPEGALSVPVADKDFNPLVVPYNLVFIPPPDSRAVILNARLYYCHKTTRMCFQDDFQTRILLESETLLKTRFPKKETGFLEREKPGFGEGKPGFDAGERNQEQNQDSGMRSPVFEETQKPASLNPVIPWVWEITPKQT